MKNFCATMDRTMDVALLSQSSLKIKGKKASLIVDPRVKMPKNNADMILALEGEIDPERVEESRLLINDDGEYEVGSVKVTGQSKGDLGIFYNLNIDNTQIILAKVSTLEKLTDTANEAEVAILNVDSGLNESIIASLEAKVVVLYGEKSQEGMKTLGKNDTPPTKKYAIAKEKLPDETQIVWLA